MTTWREQVPETAYIPKTSFIPAEGKLKSSSRLSRNSPIRSQIPTSIQTQEFLIKQISKRLNDKNFDEGKGLLTRKQRSFY